MQFNFNANRQEVEKTYNLGKGEYYKVKEGSNKVRLVSACLPHTGEYNGKPTFKWLCQVIDLIDGKVKPYFMPDKVYKDICALQMDDDYTFDEVPMPYNINIQAENAGKLEVKYSVIPSPKRIELTPEQLKSITEAPTIQEVQTKVRENDNKTGITTKEEAATQMGDEVNVANIPF